MGDIAGWAGSMLSWPVSTGSKYRWKEEATMEVVEG